MNYQLLKRLKYIFSAFVIAAMLLGCSASKNTINYSINTDGVVEAQPSTMNKDVVRLKGKLLSKAKKVNDRWQYDFKVIEIIKYGPTFATVAPEIGEEVTLITPGQVKFKRNSEVMLDALTPINRGEGKLLINMITE